MARILVIDDDPAVRAAMQMVLEREGFDVSAVGDGPSGIKLVAAEDFDLLLVDLFMPGMDGLETIRQVHRHKPGLPIVIMSGLSFASGTGAQPPDFLAMAGKLGAVGNLKKPFRPRELLAVVTQGLETSGGAGVAPLPASVRT
jgi:CheY-like chemotaxis protein